MIIGVPTEIKNNESRVSAIPGVVHELVLDGHTVYVEKRSWISFRYFRC